MNRDLCTLHVDARRRAAAVVLACGLAVLAGCAAPGPALFPPPAGAPVKVVHVTGHGWHTGLVVRVADLAPGAWPSLADSAAGEYVEVGWGDRDFYLAAQGTSGLALRAALASQASVLHVAVFTGDPAAWPYARELVELGISAPGFERLAAFVAETHARDVGGAAISLGPGLYGQSRFYLSSLRYNLARTCNTWTAEALRAAGVPIPALSITAGSVLEAAARSGRRVERW